MGAAAGTGKICSQGGVKEEGGGIGRVKKEITM